MTFFWPPKEGVNPLLREARLGRWAGVAARRAKPALPADKGIVQNLLKLSLLL
jgi:hypothetical protein